MDFDFKSIRALIDLGVLGVIAWAYIKEKSGDATNRQLPARNHAYQYGNRTYMRQLQRKPRRAHGIAAMSNIGERTAVHNGRGSLQGLHKIGHDSILHQRRHSSLRFQILSVNRFSGIGISHQDFPKTAL